MLTTGSKLGPYEIQSSIGAGGMGEVYRARDPRLGRDVAIKILPSSFSSDRDRLQRFEQEARAAAALNHPNILAIFDIGSENGAPYVVSELLEGETLRDRLRTGPLNPRRAIEFSLQILRGLAAAHEKGITHRDLKPENVFLTNDGRVKILDFGLAKLTHPETASNSGEAPTMQVATEPGLVMGTVGYMSPEQVRGKTADARSDLFAFGAILYEMLSGKRAFHGETPADTMSAILKEDPPQFSETGRNVPPGLERIVNHCLEKNPAQRFQSASDVAFNLEALSEVTTASKAGVTPVAIPEERNWLRPALYALLLIAACAVTYIFAARRHAASPVSFHRLTYRRGSIYAARFSPDGQTIIYGAALEGNPTELFTTRFDSTDSRPLGLQDTEVLSVSNNGDLAVVSHVQSTSFGQRGTLAQVSLTGGAPREILDGVDSADWTPDGSGLAVAHQTGNTYNHLEFPIGKEIYHPQGWVSHIRFSPRGDLLAFADHLATGDDGRVVITDRDGKSKATSSFYTTVEGLAWTPDGKEVWFAASPSGAARAVYAMDLSGHERVVLHVPGTLTLQDISRSGRVLLTEDNAEYQMMARAPGATSEKNLSWFDWSIVSDLSPDGKTVLFFESGEGVGAKYSVFLRQTDGSPAVRLGEGTFPALSPDGKWAAALTLSSHGQVELLPTGVGQPRQLTDDNLDRVRVRWVPDGSGLIYIGNESGQPRRSYLLDLSGKSRPITPPGTAGLFVTQDSKFLLATDPQTKRWLYPLAGGDPVPFAVKLNDGDQPLRFEPDGKSILVRTRGGQSKVSRVFLADGRREDVRQIVPPDPAGVLTIANVVFDKDCKAYAYSYSRLLSDLWVVDGLK
ncbi:MAG TPA: protein kinase [Terriglobales bacterium]|nr:protein kinase [Terriglobales bacterium]